MKLVGSAYEYFMSENIQSIAQLLESFDAFFGEQKASPLILFEMHNFKQNEKNLATYRAEFS